MDKFKLLAMAVEQSRHWLGALLTSCLKNGKADALSIIHKKGGAKMPVLLILTPINGKFDE